jgi:hypothetical protein
MITANIDQVSPEVPIACTLTGEDLQRRSEEVARLFSEGRQEVRPLPDGYAVRFPGEEVWASRLFAFIAEERACCPFFTFELVFEPGLGPIWLHLRGPAGTGEFVAAMLAQDTAHDCGGA